MNIPQINDLTLNDDTQVFINKNIVAMRNFEYAYSLLTNKDLEAGCEHIADLSDKLLLDHPTPNANSTIAYAQALVTALSKAIESALRTRCVIGSQVAYLGLPEALPQTYYINILGGDIVASGKLRTLLADEGLFEKIRGYILGLFKNAHPYSEHIYFPITTLLKTMSELDLSHGIEAPLSQSLTNKFLAFTSVSDCHSISETMVSSVLLASTLGHLIQLELPNFTPTIRATTRSTTLMLNDSAASTEIRLAVNETANTRYFNVYWQGFSNGKLCSQGTTPVRCDRIFNIGSLQMMIAFLCDFDDALIVSWQPIDNQQDYYELNA